MIIKEHKSSSGIIVALCDENIIGKKYSENGLLLDLSSDFYKGKKTSIEEVEKKCKRAYIINAVGEKCIEFLKKKGLANEKNVVRIKNIPFVQCLLLENEV